MIAFSRSARAFPRSFQRLNLTRRFPAGVFPLEGKQKAKDLELIYKGPGGRLMMPFRQ